MTLIDFVLAWTLLINGGQSGYITEDAPIVQLAMVNAERMGTGDGVLIFERHGKRMVTSGQSGTEACICVEHDHRTGTVTPLTIRFP
jgi:hypothetical protein